MDSNKKLYRSNHDKKLAGICGGLGEYLQIDSTIIRLIFVLLAFGGLAGLWIYLIMALIIPNNPGSDGNNNLTND